MCIGGHPPPPPPFTKGMIQYYKMLIIEGLTINIWWLWVTITKFLVLKTTNMKRKCPLYCSFIIYDAGASINIWYMFFFFRKMTHFWQGGIENRGNDLWSEGIRSSRKLWCYNIQFSLLPHLYFVFLTSM